MSEVPYNPNAIRQRINGVENPNTEQYRLQELDKLYTNVVIPGMATTDYSKNPFDIKRQAGDPRLPYEPKLFGWSTPDRTAQMHEVHHMTSMPELSISVHGLARISQLRLKRAVGKAVKVDRTIRSIEHAADSIATPTDGWPGHHSRDDQLRPLSYSERRRAKIMDKHALKARSSIQTTNRIESALRPLPKRPVHGKAPSTITLAPESNPERLHVKKMESALVARRLREEKYNGSRFNKAANTKRYVKKFNKLAEKARRIQSAI